MVPFWFIINLQVWGLGLLTHTQTNSHRLILLRTHPVYHSLTHTCTDTHRHMHTRVHTHSHTHTRTHIHAHTHTHTHTHACQHGWSGWAEEGGEKDASVSFSNCHSMCKNFLLSMIHTCTCVGKFETLRQPKRVCRLHTACVCVWVGVFVHPYVRDAMCEWACMSVGKRLRVCIRVCVVYVPWRYVCVCMYGRGYTLAWVHAGIHIFVCV